MWLSFQEYGGHGRHTLSDRISQRSVGFHQKKCPEQANPGSGYYTHREGGGTDLVVAMPLAPVPCGTRWPSPEVQMRTYAAWDLLKELVPCKALLSGRRPWDHDGDGHSSASWGQVQATSTPHLGGSASHTSQFPPVA